jgi:hypothetical protein
LTDAWNLSTALLELLSYTKQPMAFHEVAYLERFGEVTLHGGAAESLRAALGKAAMLHGLVLRIEGEKSVVDWNRWLP